MDLKFENCWEDVFVRKMPLTEKKARLDYKNVVE